MPQKIYIDNSYFTAGVWYYKFRALPMGFIKNEIGEKNARIIKTLEAIARAKWNNPEVIGWDYKDFIKRLKWYGLNKFAHIYRGSYGMPVLIPRTKFFYRAFTAYPNLNTVFGERGSGKTIFAWQTAYNIFEQNKDKFDEMQVYIYGDIDGMAAAVLKTCPDSQFKKSIIRMEDYEAPEAEKHIGKIIVYNEIDETLMSGNIMTKEQKAVAEMIFRSRHYQYWMIYNVIRYNSIFKTVRISSSFRSFKPLSEGLLAEVVNEGFKSHMGTIAFQTIIDLTYKDVFTSIPLYRADKMGYKTTGSRQAYTITPVIPEKWILEAASIAEKDFDVGAKKIKEKQQRMVEIAAKLYWEGKSLSQIERIMESDYKFKRSAQFWSSKISKYYYEKMGFKNLKEVKERARMDRILAEING